MRIHFLLTHLFAAGLSQASILMLDFGPTAVTGSNQTNSPYHSLNPGFTEGTWNQIQTADVGTGIVLSDNSSTSIGVNLGVANEGGVGGTLVDLGVTPSTSSTLGTVVNSGIYATTSVATDGIFSATGSAVRHIGVQITGLAAGVYEVFVATRNTNTSAAYTMTTYAGAGTAGSNFNFVTDPGYVSGALSHSGGNVAGTPTVASWNVEGTTGENYNRLTVTIAAGQALNIAVQGDGTQTRGFLNMIQIVAVPEPSSALMALGIAVPLFRRRRRTI